MDPEYLSMNPVPEKSGTIMKTRSIPSNFSATSASGAILFAALWILCYWLVSEAVAQPSTPPYPPTKGTNQIDDYHGTKIPDPYHWLEDDNSAETKAWVEAQNKVTFGYLEQIPERQAIKERLTRLWNFERYGVPFKEGGRYFLTRNDGLQNQSVLYTLDSLGPRPGCCSIPTSSRLTAPPP